MSRRAKKILRKTISILVASFVRKKAELKLRRKWQSFGIECSNICNANCSFCGYGKNIDKRKKGFVDEKTLRYALDLYERSGGGDFVFASVLGDPLADCHFLEKVKLAKTYPSIKDISIYTNLIGLDNFNMEDFMKCGIANIAISTSIGNREIYKRLFGVDAYEKVMHNVIKLLMENRGMGNPVDIKLLVRTDYEIIPKLGELDIYKKITKYLDANKVRILGRSEWDDYNGVVKITDLPKGAEFKNNIRDKKIPCYALYRKLQILKDGDITVCSCRVSPELVVDNIFNYRSLFEYWRGDRLNEIRDKWMKGNIPYVCRGCTHYLPYTTLINDVIANRIFDGLRNIKKRLT